METKEQQWNKRLLPYVLMVGIVLLIISIPKFFFSKKEKEIFITEGRIENRAYINEEVGWSIQIPDGWEISQEFNKDLNVVTSILG